MLLLLLFSYGSIEINPPNTPAGRNILAPVLIACNTLRMEILRDVLNRKCHRGTYELLVSVLSYSDEMMQVQPLLQSSLETTPRQTKSLPTVELKNREFWLPARCNS